MQKENSEISLLKKIIISTVLVFGIILFLGKVLAPFILAFLLAYILEPLVFKLNDKFKINRGVISLIFSATLFIAILSIFLFAIPALFYEFKLIVSKLPDIINYLNNDLINTVNTKYNTKFDVDFINIDISNFSLQNGLKSHPEYVRSITISGIHVFEKLLLSCLFPIILYFSILNFHALCEYIKSVIPNTQRNILTPVVDDIVNSLSRYIRGQSIVMAIMLVYYVSAMYFTHGFVLVGILTASLLFIPYLGIITGLLLSIIISITSSGSDIGISTILIIYGIGYVLEHWIVIPYFIGNSIGVHPIIMIMFILIFAYVFGIIGVMLALPLTAIFSVLIKRMYLGYTKSLK